MSGFSDERKTKILNAAFGGAKYEENEENYLALVTVAVLGSDKGTTITEPTYTGYARIAMKNSQWAAPEEGKRHNNTAKVFAECTAGSSTCIGWAYCTTAETKSGLVICSGVIPSTVVSAGITPEFLSGALVYTLSDT